MTTDVAPSIGDIATRRFERAILPAVAGFAVLFTAQCTNSLPGFAGSTGGTAGTVLIGLVLLGVLAGPVAIVAPAWSTVLFRAGFALYAAALALWPFTVGRALTPGEGVWIVAVWPAFAVYLAAGHRLARTAIVMGVATAVPMGLVLVRVGGLGPAEATVAVAYVVCSSAVAAALLGSVRHTIEVAEEAAERAAEHFATARLGDVEERERIRTDALVHDCVLTTLLSAGSALSPAEEDLSRRMAANALRVLGHVTRSSEQGPAVPFDRALAQIRDRHAAVAGRFTVRTVGTDDLMLPAHVATAVLDGMLAVMREGVAADGSTRRSVRAKALGPDGIRITVRDDARFEVPASLAERMQSIDGRVETAHPAEGGTAVTLSWGSAVITGTAPRETGELVGAA